MIVNGKFKQLFNAGIISRIIEKYHHKIKLKHYARFRQSHGRFILSNDKTDYIVILLSHYSKCFNSLVISNQVKD